MVVFERFDFDIEATQRNVEGMGHRHIGDYLQDVGKILKKNLSEKNYENHPSKETYYGIPKSVIIPGEGGVDQGDFLRTVNALGLEFESKAVYGKDE